MTASQPTVPFGRSPARPAWRRNGFWRLRLGYRAVTSQLVEMVLVVQVQPMPSGSLRHLAEGRRHKRQCLRHPRTVPWALEGLTAVFGMGTGVPREIRNDV
jgi:hypothetical protein